MVSYANGKLSKVDYLPGLKTERIKKVRIFQGTFEVKSNEIL